MHAISSNKVWSRAYCKRERIGVCANVCVGLCYHGINHWSWAGGWCCSIHLSLSAGVRYFTLMMGRTERGEKKSATLESCEMDRKINAVVPKGSVCTMRVCGGTWGKGCIEAFSSHNPHLCRARFSLPKICFCEIDSVIQWWEKKTAHVMRLCELLPLLQTGYIWMNTQVEARNSISLWSLYLSHHLTC